MKDIIINISDKEIDGLKTIDLNLIKCFNVEDGKLGLKPKVVGGCTIAYMDRSPTILSIHINPEYRGNGLCRRLMNTCYTMILANNRFEAYLFVKDGNCMGTVYERYGFEYTGQETNDGQKWMRKDLKQSMLDE